MSDMSLLERQRTAVKLRREALVGSLLSGAALTGGVRWSHSNPDRAAAQAYAIREAFELADAVIAESNRREKDGE